MKEHNSNGVTGNLTMDLRVADESFEFASSVSSALESARIELQSVEETIESVKNLKPECDKLDYILAASSGALCSMIDIFLVGKPKDSSLGNITDQWFADRTCDFAKLNGWNGETQKSAIRFLENKFKIPYDQRGAGDAGGFVFNLNPTNHHFKSLAHNPTLCGLFFSVLDQFSNASHFVTNGDLITLEDACEGFELHGNDFPSKLVCAFINWLGHLVSDVSGASGSSGRGMGIPSPFWAWINDVNAILRSLGIPATQFQRNIGELAVNIYKEGYDARFQAAQAIPVFINEIVVRTIYSVRRMIRYFYGTNKSDRSFKAMWGSCEPFTNSSIKRMLLIAHGTFCLMDLGDATAHGFMEGGGSFNAVEFFLRLNIIGIGRFTISLYGEGKRTFHYLNADRNAKYAKKEKIILEDYLEGLNILAYRYDDRQLLMFVDNLKDSGLYKTAFQQTIELAERRGVSQERILRTKSDVDEYFRRR